MPLVLEFSHFIYLDVLEKYFSQFTKGYDQADNLIFKNSVTASQYYLYYNLFFYLQVAAFILILIVYPPYPFTYSIRRYFEKKGYPVAVAEYEIIKKIVYLAVSVLIFLLILEKLDEVDASLEPDVLAPMLEKTGYLPTQTSIAEGPSLTTLNQTIPYFDKMLSMVQSGRGRPNIPEFAQMDDYVTEAGKQVCTSTKDPKQALDDAAKKSAKLLGW